MPLLSNEIPNFSDLETDKLIVLTASIDIPDNKPNIFSISPSIQQQAEYILTKIQGDDEIIFIVDSSRFSSKIIKHLKTKSQNKFSIIDIDDFISDKYKTINTKNIVSLVPLRYAPKIFKLTKETDIPVEIIATDQGALRGSYIEKMESVNNTKDSYSYVKNWDNETIVNQNEFYSSYNQFCMENQKGKITYLNLMTFDSIRLAIQLHKETDRNTFIFQPSIHDKMVNVAKREGGYYFETFND